MKPIDMRNRWAAWLPPRRSKKTPIDMRKLLARNTRIRAAWEEGKRNVT